MHFTGYGGPYSHYAIRSNCDYTCAIDFNLDLGTEIVASREGRVRYFYEKVIEYYEGTFLDLKKSPFFPEKFIGNFIKIRHDDGTVALYKHFMPESISKYVEKGQIVKQGDKIGLFGLSGWIGKKSHLHFSVSKRFQIGQKIALKTIPIKFNDYDSISER